MTASILGFFAMAWFGWGQSNSSSALSVALAAGSAAAGVVTALGAVAAFRWRRAGGGRERAVDRRYGIVVAIEFASAGAGAAILGATGTADYVPVWICAVVGLHFFALAEVLGVAALRWLGASVTAVAAIALVAGLLATVAPGSVTGAGAGLALLAYATMSLGTSDPLPRRRSRART